jgi:glycosyltransferase involved in cell wall biosynthesis
MRLLYVIHQFFPDCHSGTEQYCLALAREAQRHGDEVTVLSLHWDHDRDWPSIRLFEQPYEGLPVLRLNHWRRINSNDVLRDYENRHLEGWFRAVLESVQPDAVHFFHLRQLGSNLLAVANAASVRSVVSLTDFWFLCPRFTLLRRDGSLCEGPPEGGRGCIACEFPELAGVVPMTGSPSLTDDPPARLRALLDRKDRQLQQLELADAVVAPSQFLAGMFVRNGLRPDRLQVLPYGLAAERIQRMQTPDIAATAQRQSTSSRAPLRIAFCGVLSPWKAPHLLLDAVRGLPGELVCTVHGRLEEPMFAEYIAGLRRQAEGDGRIRFAGPYGEADVSRVFAGIDVLVVPSTWYENTPFVVLEAFAAGVPVVASDLGGLSEVVRDGQNGLLFRAGDAAALRAALQRLLVEPDLLPGLRPAAPPTMRSNYQAFAATYRGPQG